MSLVAYEGGSSDGESDNDDDTNVSYKHIPLAALPKPKNQNGSHEESILGALPTPKASSGVEEEDDEFLKKKEVPAEKPPPNKRIPARILLPALSSFTEEEEEERRPRFEPPTKGTGLLSILPRPRAEVLNVNRKPNAKLVPRVLNQPKSKPQPKPTKAVEIKPLAAYGSSGESDGSDAEDQPGEIDFFSLAKKEEPLEPNPEDLSNGDIPMEVVNNDIPHDSIGAEEYPQREPEISQADDPSIPQSSEGSYVELGEEAMRALCSNRERRKGKGQAIQFIDIDQKEMLPDRREWMTKALTENPSRGLSKGGPGGVSKRKHQITYLAQQAKANEQELQNRWAQNKMTRKQTQSKYGF